MRTIMFATAMAALAAPIAMSAPADARTRHHSVSHHRNVHHYRHRCYRGHGTTGLLVGGGAGALLGRHIQRHARCS